METEPEQSGAEETAPKGKPTRADVLREARRRRAERSESVRAYQGVSYRTFFIDSRS